MNISYSTYSVDLPNPLQSETVQRSNSAITRQTRGGDLRQTRLDRTEKVIKYSFASVIEDDVNDLLTLLDAATGYRVTVGDYVGFVSIGNIDCSADACSYSFDLTVETYSGIKYPITEASDYIISEADDRILLETEL
jgi:hypothetical protein